MSTAPTLPRTPAVPPPTPPSRRRRVAILGALALVVVAILAVGSVTGWFGAVDRDTAPSSEPDATTPDQPDATTPEQPDVPPGEDVAPDLPDDVAPPPRYRDEPRANWDVIGVAAGDVLNVRNGPGSTFAIVATLANDAAELESTGRIADVGNQLWREIVVPGDGVGWVNAAYLTETAPPTAYAQEPRANWDVIGVAAGDVLNVRNGPGSTFAIVATLANDAAELESTGRIADVGNQLWREIVVPGDGVGWVNAAFLTETG
jgi:uncharacterized protein YgiM (DUF1202 family)